MFTSIKGKLLNVKKNVKLFSTDDQSSKTAPPSEFNPQAGARILQHFQDQWEDIHKSNEENAVAAEKVANEIEMISKTVSDEKENITLIVHILSNSNLTKNIANCLKQVKDLYSECETVEKKLLDLENLVEEIEVDNLIQRHRQHLENYKQRKESSLDILKQSLEQQYNNKLLEYESCKKPILEERQKVFQEAFKNDMEMYKNLGAVPKVDLPKNQNSAILEEIQLDFDQNELEQFFNDKDVPSNQ